MILSIFCNITCDHLDIYYPCFYNFNCFKLNESFSPFAKAFVFRILLYLFILQRWLSYWIKNIFKKNRAFIAFFGHLDQFKAIKSHDSLEKLDNLSTSFFDLKKFIPTLEIFIFPWSSTLSRFFAGLFIESISISSSLAPKYSKNDF